MQAIDMFSDDFMEEERNDAPKQEPSLDLLI